MQLEKVKAASALSNAGEEAVKKRKFEDGVQCRKRVEKAFESEKLAAVLLR